MAPFGGYDMPIQYTGIIKEHQACRCEAVIFDTCHMGEFIIGGQTAVPDLEKLLSCDVASLKIGSCRYGFICNEQGGVIDDQILYRIGETEFMMVVNASTEENDFQWVSSHLSESTKIENISSRTAKLDIQGPNAPRIVQSLLKDSITDLKYYTFAYNYYNNEKVIVSRTGYTGEIGFEIYLSNDLAVSLWNDCISRGAVPAGLGCRDTLRLEMGFPLYGHELDSERNAAESGFSRAISTKKQFIGSARVSDQSNTAQILRGVSLEGRRAARHGDLVLNKEGDTIGIVTSGSFSPSLGSAVSLAYINKKEAAMGSAVQIQSGKALIPGTVSELPFYKQATARADLSVFLTK